LEQTDRSSKQTLWICHRFYGAYVHDGGLLPCSSKKIIEVGANKDNPQNNMSLTEGQSVDSVVTQALNLLTQIDQHSQQFYSKM
jgi:hypothetical protein